MTLSTKPYKGTRDFFPADKRVQDFLFKKMRECAELFAYEPYDGPLLEEVELYKAKSGEELINDQIYSFVDRGERFVAIRPEMTPTLARMIAACHREVPKPIRWYAIPNLMRYERPQRGRLREHWQFNCDIFGAPEAYGEFEIIQLAITLFERFGANTNHFSVRINDRRLVDALFSHKMGLTKDIQHKLYKIVDRAKKVSKDDLNKSLTELGLSVTQLKLFSDYLELNDLNSMLSYFKTIDAEAIKPVEKFIQLMQKTGLLPYLKYDPSVVRGLDYYTGIVFEIFDEHPENNRALCGGGAYSDLLKIFGQDPLPGVGFGLGDVTLRNFLESHSLMPDFKEPLYKVFVSFQDEELREDMLKLSRELRSKNISTLFEFEATKFKKVFATAEKKHVEYVILYGSEEKAEGKVQLKNLKTQESKKIALADIVKVLHD
jgi:histidyl-tRNA synthetase